MKHATKERDEQLARLRDWIKPGDTVYTIMRHKSRSGMRRHISLAIFRDGRPLHPNYAASVVLGYRQDKKTDALIVDGGGMDMGFHLVYSLAAALYNGLGEDGKPDGKGFGYALRQEWL